MRKGLKLMGMGFVFVLVCVFLTGPAFAEEKSPLFDVALKNSVASLASSEIAISPGMAKQDAPVVVASVANREGSKASVEKFADQLAQVMPTLGRTCRTCGTTCGGQTCGETCGATCGATCGGQTCGATCSATCGETCGATCGATCGGQTCGGQTCGGRTCLGAQTCNSLTCQGVTCAGRTCSGPGCNPSPSR